MKTVYQDYQIVLTTGEFRSFQCHGRYLTILENSVSDDMLVQFDGQPSQPLPKGLSVEIPENENFITISFRNPSVSSATIRFSISNGKVYDNRNVITGTVDVDDVSNTLDSPAAFAVDDTAQIAVASDSTVKEVILQNNGANAVWIGDSNVTPASSRGIKIDADTSMVVSSSDDIYARCAAGLTSTLSILKLRKV